MWSLGYVSQKNCSNEVKTLGSASTEPVIFCCGKTAAASLLIGDAAFSVLGCGLFPLLTAFPQSTEYCLGIPYGDPVRIRNNRPLLCLSQRACGINWVYHALTGECSLIYDVGKRQLIKQVNKLNPFRLAVRHIGRDFAFVLFCPLKTNLLWVRIWVRLECAK